MSETPPPYTGKSKAAQSKAAQSKAAQGKAAQGTAAQGKAASEPASKAAQSKAGGKPARKPAPTPSPAPAPAVPPPAAAPALPAQPVTAPVVGYVTIWHSRAVLIGVAALAALTAIGTAVGAAGFPSNAPVESIYAFGVIVDMVAVVVALIILTIVEFRRRADPIRLGLPVNPRPSVFAIIAICMAGLTLLAWVVGDGPNQVIDLVQGLRARYMYHTGGLVAAGVPWALSLIFGAWGFRPRAHVVTNVLAVVAIVISGLLAVAAVVAALVYGAGLSD